MADSLINFSLSNDLTQCVNEITRFSTSDSILDLLFTSDVSLIKNVQIKPGISDHEAVCFNLLCKPRLLDKVNPLDDLLMGASC